ncbi:ribonuclease H-like domain-containing protein [Tanacetum coccineum]
MESQSETTQTVSALKLHILKTGDYDLWSMRIEQYLTHTDYALWEVIMNGDAPANASTSTEGPISAKTAKQKLGRKNELKAKSTLLLAIPNEHLLKSEGLDKTYDRFQKLISQLEIHASNSDNVLLYLHKNTSSTNEAVNIAHEVSTARSHGQASSLTYADDVMFSFFVNQSNSSQLNNEDLEQIDTDDLEEMDLKWQVAMLTMRVNRFLKKTGRNLNFNGKETVGFDKTNVGCYNCHRRGHFARECRAPRNYGKRNGDSPRRIVPVETPTNALVVQDGIGYQMGLESLESRIVVHEKNEIDSIYKTNVSETISSVPRTKSTASKSSKDSLEQPKDVRHNDPIIEDWDTDSDNDSVFRPKPDQTKPKFTKINFVKSEENVKSVYKENTHWQEEYPRKMPLTAAKQSSPRAATSISIARHVNTATLKPKVNAASPTKYSYFKVHSPLRRPFNQKSAAKTNNFNKKVYTAKVNNVTTAGPEVVVSTAEGKRENVVKSSTCWIWRPTGKGNPQYALQDQGIFDSGCSRHMTGNKSYLTDYQDINGGFVAFARSPKGCKITERRESNSMPLVRQGCNALSAIPYKFARTYLRQNFEKASDHEYILLPLMLSNSPLSSSSHNKDADEVPGKGDDDLNERNGQEKEE